MQEGIHNITIENNDDGTTLRAGFGPHHTLTLDEDENGNVTFELASTHHGFQADASGPDVPTELEDMINTIREEYPENNID